MERFRYSVSLMIVLALVFVFAGCAKPPDAEKSAAKAAMDAAVSAGADKYAATDFGTAKGLWDTAESQMVDKRYKEAKKGYIDAKSGFEFAARGVEAGKKAMTDAVSAALFNLQNDWGNLEATAKKAGKNMKDKKADWTADEKTFTDGLQATKDMIATDPAGGQAKVDELKSIIDKWDTTFKELAAAPAQTEKPKKK